MYYIRTIKTARGGFFHAPRALCPFRLLPFTLRHRQREGGAFAGAAFRSYLRVVERGYLFDERQAEAEAAA